MPALRQQRLSPLASGSPTNARASNSNGPMGPHVKNLNNAPTPTSTRPQTIAPRSATTSVVTQADKEPTHTQQTPSSPSTSGTPPSRRNKHRNRKKVRRIYRLVRSGALTRYDVNRFRSRRIQQPSQVLRRKVYHQSEALFWDRSPCRLTRYA